MVVRLAACIALVAVLAGCVGVDYSCYAAPTVASVNDGGPTLVGTFEHEVVVRVLQPDSEGVAGVPGARVAAMWAIPVATSVDDGDAAAIRSIARGARTTSEERFVLVTAGAMTDADGRVTLRVPHNSILQAAATAPGLTTAHIGPLGRGDDLPQELSIVIVPERALVTVDGTLPAGIATPASIRTGETHALDWPNGQDLMQERLVTLKVDLRWTNEPLAAGDLRLHVGDAPGQAHAASYGHTYPAVALQGARTDGIELAEDLHTWARVVAWVDTEDLVAPLQDLPYRIESMGTFAGNGDMPEVCVPTEYVIHGPMDVSEFEATIAGHERDAPASPAALLIVLLGALAAWRRHPPREPPTAIGRGGRN